MPVTTGVLEAEGCPCFPEGKWGQASGDFSQPQRSSSLEPGQDRGVTFWQVLRTSAPATRAASHRLLLWSSGHVALLGSAPGRQQPPCEVVVLASDSLEQGLGKQMTSG